MKIEEIPSNNKKERLKKYWFPFSKGYNRLIVIFGIIVMIFIINKKSRCIYDYVDLFSYYEDLFSNIIFIIIIEVLIYIAAIWVYRGFKDLRDKQS